MSSQPICRICNAKILPVTASQTGGLCMPCANGTRYRHADYLSIDEFFSKCSSDYCLAPNLEPRPRIAEFKAALIKLSQESGVILCVIPVVEFEDVESRLEPYSDRIFVAGPVAEAVIAAWARDLGAEFYREERPGAEIPREYSKDQPGWLLVWD